MFLPVVGVYPSNKVITLDKDLLFSFKPLPDDDKTSLTSFLFLKNFINLEKTTQKVLRIQ